MAQIRLLVFGAHVGIDREERRRMLLHLELLKVVEYGICAIRAQRTDASRSRAGLELLRAISALGQLAHPTYANSWCGSAKYTRSPALVEVHGAAVVRVDVFARHGGRLLLKVRIVGRLPMVLQK